MFRLSTATPEQKEMTESLISQLKKGTPYLRLMDPAPAFNEHGLRFDLEYLRQIGVLVIVLPMEMAAEYVDVITKDAVDSGNYSPLLQVLKGHGSSIDMDMINATAIGNLAYIALHDKNPIVQKRAERKLDKIFCYFLKIGQDPLMDFPN